MNIIFGQLVVGPPGSGKTTYCKNMAEFLESLGRKVVIINIGQRNIN
jgi:predicted PilT family ATPase